MIEKRSDEPLALGGEMTISEISIERMRTLRFSFLFPEK